MSIRMNRLRLAVCVFAACFAAHADTLWDGFRSPPDSAKPWCYWWWINGHADRETITADLESMKEMGFAGLLMFDSRGYWEDDDHLRYPKAELEWGSDRWLDLVEFSIRECARLGLKFTMNASASGGKLNGFMDGREYDVDVFSRDEVRAHLDRVIGSVVRRVPNLVGTVFTHIYSVSYEGGLRDGGTWLDLKDGFYREMYGWARERNLKVYSEASGPWMHGAKALVSSGARNAEMFDHVDFPQGEFWPLQGAVLARNASHANANAKYFCRAAVVAARRRNLPIVSAEAFTHMHHHWSVDPAFLKPTADQAFADGVNHLVWHTFTCSPKKYGVPGVEYFAGSHINRNVTWHREAAPFVRYLGRCQYMLRQAHKKQGGCRGGRVDG